MVGTEIEKKFIKLKKNTNFVFNIEVKCIPYCINDIFLLKWLHLCNLQTQIEQNRNTRNVYTSLKQFIIDKKKVTLGSVPFK